MAPSSTGFSNMPTGAEASSTGRSGLSVVCCVAGVIGGVTGSVVGTVGGGGVAGEF